MLSLNERVMNGMKDMVKEVTKMYIVECGKLYNFNVEEALSRVGLEEMRLNVEKKEKKDKKEKKKKSKCPFPFDGLKKENCCVGVRYNRGLYTQCENEKYEEDGLCKSCKGAPYGRIEDRLSKDVLEYVDPKGNKVVAYTKVMKKLKLTEEDVKAEAAKFNKTIADMHFEVQEEKVKRGRPKSDKPEKVKNAKGRPKKAEKAIEIAGEEDLFASLVAQANSESEGESEGESESDKKADKEAKEAAKKADKEAKEAAKKADKEAKEAAKKADKEAKEAAKKAEKEAKEAEKKAVKKETKKADKKEAKKEAKKADKKADKKANKEEEKEEDKQVDSVKKQVFEGKTYLVSKNTGVVYDYEKFKEGETIVLGKWNSVENKVVFSQPEEEEEEEEEEEYDE